MPFTSTVRQVSAAGAGHGPALLSSPAHRFRQKRSASLVYAAVSLAIVGVAGLVGLAIAAVIGAGGHTADAAHAALAAAVLTWCADLAFRDSHAVSNSLPARRAAFASGASLLVIVVLGRQIVSAEGMWIVPAALASFIGVLPLAELVAHAMLRKSRIEKMLRPRVAIYGATEDAIVLRAEILRREMQTLVGLFEDRRPGSDRTAPVGIDGCMDDLVELARQGSLDAIVITLPIWAAGRIAELTSRLQALPVKILAPLDVAAHVAAIDAGARMQSHLLEVGGMHLVTCRDTPIGDVSGLAKALFDRVCAAALLVGLSPLFVIIAAAIRLESRGPVFFRQKRHGLAGEDIVVWKFRTMKVQENGAVIRQATKNDPRVTRVGAWLRKSSFDEFPQLINVLMGTMSLVGPRPHAIAHNEHYAALISSYNARCRVRPGITGWAQINGFRGETQTTEEMATRVKYDIWYVTNWSFWLDLKILLLTPIRGFVHKNAY